MTRRNYRRLVFGPTLVPLFVGLAATPGVSAQSTPAGPRFTTVSLKLTDQTPDFGMAPGGGPSPNRPTQRTTPGGIDYHLIPLQSLVLMAYPLADYQFVWPAWMTWMNIPAVSPANNAGRGAISTGRGANGLLINANPNANRIPVQYYDLSATRPPDTTPEQTELMFQALLMDRFKMSSHWETRDMQMFVLKVASGGLKIQKLPDSYKPAGGISRHIEAGGWSLYAQVQNDPTAIAGMTIAQFIRFFDRRQTGKPMTDMTGLDGYYNIHLSVTVGVGPGGRARIGTDNDEIFRAMEDQLGLTVSEETVPTKILIIDKLDGVPTGN